MEPEVFVDIVREALGLVALLVAVAILPSLAVGLIVALIGKAKKLKRNILKSIKCPSMTKKSKVVNTVKN